MLAAISQAMPPQSRRPRSLARSACACASAPTHAGAHARQAADQAPAPVLQELEHTSATLAAMGAGHATLAKTAGQYGTQRARVQKSHKLLGRMRRASLLDTAALWGGVAVFALVRPQHVAIPQQHLRSQQDLRLQLHVPELRRR